MTSGDKVRAIQAVVTLKNNGLVDYQEYERILHKIVEAKTKE